MSIFYGEHRFFGQPKVQEAYNIINFWWKTASLKYLVPWMLIHPTSDLNTYRARPARSSPASLDCTSNFQRWYLSGLLPTKRIDFISRKMNRCYLISKGWLTRKLIDDLIFKFSWDDGSLKFRAKISWFDVHKDLRETEEEKNSWNYYGMHTYMLCQLEHYGCFWILLSKRYLIQISILGTNMHHVYI